MNVHSRINSGGSMRQPGRQPGSGRMGSPGRNPGWNGNHQPARRHAGKKKKGFRPQTSSTNYHSKEKKSTGWLTLFRKERGRDFGPARVHNNFRCPRTEHLKQNVKQIAVRPLKGGTEGCGVKCVQEPVLHKKPTCWIATWTGSTSAA